MGSVGQRAAKLLSVKGRERFNPGRSQTRADWFESGRGQMADFFLRPQTLTASNFNPIPPRLISNLFPLGGGRCVSRPCQ